MSYEKRKAISAFSRYMRSDCDSIFGAYKNPSRDKRVAWEHCKKLCSAYDGFRLRVIAKNCHVFSAGFQFVDADSGEHRFMYITRGYEVIVSPC